MVACCLSMGPSSCFHVVTAKKYGGQMEDLVGTGAFASGGGSGAL